MLRLVRLLLLLLPPAAPARDVDPDLLVRIWQSEEGLPGNVVRSIGQSPNGFLWVATAEGIARFDGIEFEEVGPVSEIRSRRLGFFRLFTVSSGDVWVSTFDGGLHLIRGMNLQTVIAEGTLPERQRVNQLIEHSGGVIFKRGGEIWTTDGSTASPLPEPDEETLAALDRDLERQLDGGRVTREGDHPELVDRKGMRWTLRDRGRLHYQLPGGAERTARIPELEGRILVNEMFEDREGNLWLATPVQGLIRLRHSRITRIGTAQGLFDRPVNTAIQTRDGAWWIANRGSGLERITNDRATHLDLIPGGYQRPAVCLYEDRANRLWVAARDGTLFEWNGEGFDPRFSDSPGLSKIAAITEDHQDRLWFGGDGVLAVWDGTTLEKFAGVELLHGVNVTTLAMRDDGALLAGTRDGRIILHKDGDFLLFGSAGDLGGQWISGIHPVSSNEIWVATLGSGLLLWKEGAWHRFDSSGGLPDDRLTAIVPSGEDELWLGSLGGILRASRTELLLRTVNPDFRIRWLRLDRSDGLLTRECIGGSQPGAWKAADGSIWFPTGHGLVGIHPDQIETSRTPPSVFIRPVKINGLPTSPVNGVITAGPGRVRLEFDYTGLSLSSPEKVTYRSRLAGLEQDTKFVGDQRGAVYEAVPPGRYRFEVTAVNGDGIAGIRPSIVDIIVRPRLWETPWFLALAIVGGLALAILGGWIVARSRMKSRIQELKIRSALQSERARISRDLHDDLGASLTELSILSALSAENSDESALRPSLTRLSQKAKTVVGTLDEIVWAANPREDSLRSLIEYLSAFAREFLENAAISLRAEIDRDIPDAVIGPNRRHNVFLATREALNNAVKHSGAAEIRLRIAVNDWQLVIRIQDNGRGFAVDYATGGNGLSNLRRRMADCGGACSIESRQGGGSVITLTLPLPPPRPPGH